MLCSHAKFNLAVVGKFKVTNQMDTGVLRIKDVLVMLEDVISSLVVWWCNPRYSWSQRQLQLYNPQSLNLK